MLFFSWGPSFLFLRMRTRWFIFWAYARIHLFLPPARNRPGAGGLVEADGYVTPCRFSAICGGDHGIHGGRPRYRHGICRVILPRDLENRFSERSKNDPVYRGGGQPFT